MRTATRAGSMRPRRPMELPSRPPARSPPAWNAIRERSATGCSASTLGDELSLYGFQRRRVDLGPRGQVVDGHLEFLEDLDQLGELFPGQLVALPLGDREAQPVRRGDREELDALPHRLHRAV